MFLKQFFFGSSSSNDASSNDVGEASQAVEEVVEEVLLDNFVKLACQSDGAGLNLVDVTKATIPSHPVIMGLGEFIPPPCDSEIRTIVAFNTAMNRIVASQGSSLNRLCTVGGLTRAINALLMLANNVPIKEVELYYEKYHPAPCHLVEMEGEARDRIDMCTVKPFDSLHNLRHKATLCAVGDKLVLVSKTMRKPYLPSLYYYHIGLCILDCPEVSSARTRSLKLAALRKAANGKFTMAVHLLDYLYLQKEDPAFSVRLHIDRIHLDSVY